MYETKPEPSSEKGLPHDEHIKGQDHYETQQHPHESPQPTHAQRPLNNRSEPSSMSVVSTDDEYYGDPLLTDDGIHSSIPLEALAGPALILPSNDIDGRTLNEEFDWGGREDDDDEMDKKDDSKKKGGALAQSGVIICLNKNSSHIAWFCIVLFGLILIAIDVALHVVYKNRIGMTSYNLQLWFTWIAFMWCIGFMSQIFVELVPWAIKKGVGFLRPQSTEVLRMRLSVSCFFQYDRKMNLIDKMLPISIIWLCVFISNCLLSLLGHGDLGLLSRNIFNAHLFARRLRTETYMNQSLVISVYSIASGNVSFSVPCFFSLKSSFYNL